MATFSSHETQAQAPRPPNPQDFATAAVDPNRLGGPSWAFAGAVWIVASSPGPCCVLHAGSTLVCSPILLGGHCGQASSSKLFMHPSSKDSLGNTCMHIYITLPSCNHTFRNVVCSKGPYYLTMPSFQLLSSIFCSSPHALHV